MATTGMWRQYFGIHDQITGLVLRDVESALAARPLGAKRNATTDDPIFSPLANATVVAIGRGEFRLAVEMFHDCFSSALRYEAASGCEVHKGAMAFNVAIAYLRANDFSAAMHHFEMAQREDHLATGDANHNVYQSDLFRRSFWDVLDLFEQQSPLAWYPVFWGTPFGSAAALHDWAALSPHSKLLYVILNAERVSLTRRRLQPLTGWPGGESVGLAYWNLVAGLARLLETELGQLGIHGGGLRAKVLSGVNNSPVVGFKGFVTHLHDTMPVSNPAEYNAHFPTVRAIIEDAGRSREERIATGAYLAAITRNQVQHLVDTGMILFANRDAATFTVDVLLTLCRVGAWAA